ncbi:MAG TPA: homocysteine S-methyltransferase [Nakamurella sp.]|nr:homocysteine S-methyltransferase [Nakamurella sp.]
MSTTADHHRPVGVTLAERLASGPVVLDGGLATLLEAHGHDLTSALWSARLLLDDPGAITAAHREYFAAGAQVAIASSYQASFDGFAALGLDRDAAADALRRSVALAREAAAQAPKKGPDPAPGLGERWVAASVGPYGAALADGSEYRGDYGLSVAELRAWHRPRLQVLAAAGADVLAIETIPCLAEVQALLEELRGTGMPAWLSLTCADGRTRAGEPASEAFAMAADVDEIIAVGVNCCAADQVLDLVELAVQHSGKPAVVYPNSGERWDAEGRCWSGTSTFGPEHAAEWIEAGTRLVGGCCRVGPTAINRLAAAVRGRTVPDPSTAPSTAPPHRAG